MLRPGGAAHRQRVCLVHPPHLPRIQHRCRPPRGARASLTLLRCMRPLRGSLRDCYSYIFNDIFIHIVYAIVTRVFSYVFFFGGVSLRIFWDRRIMLARGRCHSVNSGTVFSSLVCAVLSSFHTFLRPESKPFQFFSSTYRHTHFLSP